MLQSQAGEASPDLAHVRDTLTLGQGPASWLSGHRSPPRGPTHQALHSRGGGLARGCMGQLWRTEVPRFGSLARRPEKPGMALPLSGGTPASPALERKEPATPRSSRFPSEPGREGRLWPSGGHFAGLQPRHKLCPSRGARPAHNCSPPARAAFEGSGSCAATKRGPAALRHHRSLASAIKAARDKHRRAGAGEAGGEQKVGGGNVL